jgi:WXXGXW repeat (2 copies)
MTAKVRLRLVIFTVIGALAWGALGCASAPPHRVVYVMRGPPDDIVEVVPAQTDPAAVWIKGHYRWDGDGYRWVSGHWQVPPSGYHEWAAGQWVARDGRWVWIEGRWR